MGGPNSGRRPKAKARAVPKPRLNATVSEGETATVTEATLGGDAPTIVPPPPVGVPPVGGVPPSVDPALIANGFTAFTELDGLSQEEKAEFASGMFLLLANGVILKIGRPGVFVSMQEARTWSKSAVRVMDKWFKTITPEWALVGTTATILGVKLDWPRILAWFSRNKEVQRVEVNSSGDVPPLSEVRGGVDGGAGSDRKHPKAKST